MFLDYELAISCALAALVILHIIHLRRKWLRVREQRRSIGNAVDTSRDPTWINQAGARHSQDVGNQSSGRSYDRVIVILLVLALLWFGGRIWMEI